MDLEVRGLPQDIRPKFSNRLKSYEKELQRLEKEFVSSNVVFFVFNCHIDNIRCTYILLLVWYSSRVLFLPYKVGLDDMSAELQQSATYTMVVLLYDMIVFQRRSKSAFSDRVIRDELLNGEDHTQFESQV